MTRIVGVVAWFCWVPVGFGALVFEENFNRADGPILGNGWAETDTGGGNAVLESGLLRIVNGSPSGRSFVSVQTTDFAEPYNSRLDANPGVVRWSFNMRSNRDNLSGFGGNKYGIAFVLATSSIDFLAGTGYAVVWGSSGTQPLRLVRYDQGLVTGSTITDLVTASLAPFADMGANYFSIQVSYDPAGDGWDLFARDDGVEFSDPTLGALVPLGGAVDSVHTGIELDYMGALWNYSTAAGNSARFDNVSVTVVPEAETAGLLAVGILVAGFCFRQVKALIRKSREP